MRQGRPLRFLVLVLAGWTAARMAMLAPGAPPAAGPPLALVRTTGPATLAPAAGVATRPPARDWPRDALIATAPPDARPHRRVAATVAATPAGPVGIGAGSDPAPVVAPLPRTTIATPAPLPPPAGPLPTRRLRIDGWVLVRNRGSGTPLTPQLGGSQAGVRIAYALGRGDRLAAFARVASPLGAGDPEVAAGVQYRLPGLPLTAFAELRQVADRPLAPGVGAFGGIDRRLGPLRLTGYAQGGYAGGRARTFYADGQLGMTQPLARLGPTNVSGGVGAWGAAQRGAARLDLGPGIAVARGPIRLGLDWRLRAAGDARPGSGPTLTLAGNF